MKTAGKFWTIWKQTSASLRPVSEVVWKNKDSCEPEWIDDLIDNMRSLSKRERTPGHSVAHIV